MRVECDEMVYVAVAIGLIVLGVILRYTVFSPIPRSIASLTDAERLVNYHIDAANRRLRHDAWMLTFVVSQLDLNQRTVTVRIGINYGRRGSPNYLGKISADLGQRTGHVAGEGENQQSLREKRPSGTSRDLYLGGDRLG